MASNPPPSLVIDRNRAQNTNYLWSETKLFTLLQHQKDRQSKIFFAFFQKCIETERKIIIVFLLDFFLFPVCVLLCLFMKKSQLIVVSVKTKKNSRKTNINFCSLLRFYLCLFIFSLFRVTGCF